MRAWCLRLVIVLLAGVILLPTLVKPHFVSVPQRPCFLGVTTGHLLVRVIETGGSQAIYRISDGTTVRDVKNMTLDDSGLDSLSREVLSHRLRNGDVVEFSGEVDRISGITLRNMPVSERIVLCIPLDPDIMSLSDWMALPGVGRSLAEAIVTDRQKNGEFCAIEGVSRVPGVGPGRIKFLKQFF
jgi:competence protein ComEA